MKSLIAIVNCRKRQDTWADAIRKTWLPLVPKDKADAFFFVGRGEGTMPADTIELDCDDSYAGLPDKIRAIARWAHDKEIYSYMLKCDDDVVLFLEPLLASEYTQVEYTGRLNRPITAQTPYTVPMGFNYWLSRKCMALVKDAELPPNSNDDEKWVAGILHNAQIRLTDDIRYRLHYGLHVNRPVRVNRPLRPRFIEPVNGEFSWCVFLEGNSGERIPTDVKIAEFNRLFHRVYPFVREAT